MTSLTLSAAPPRASPSSLDRITPSIGERAVERLGDVDRVLAGHRVDDEERVVGRDGAGDLADLLHHLGVDGEAAGGVDDEHVAAEAAGLGEARGDVATGSPGSENTGTSICAAERAQLLDGGGALEVGARPAAGCGPGP